MANQFKYDIFLSHNSQDKAEVEKIALFLKDKGGLECWLDSWFIELGDSINDKLVDGLKNSKVIAVFYGDMGKGKWQDEEIKVAINWGVNKGTKVIPILLPGFLDPQNNIDPFLQDKLYLDLREGIGQRDVLTRLIGIISPDKQLKTKSIATESRSDSPDIGPLAHKLCDRKRQSDKFEHIIKDVVDDDLQRSPKYFFVHGEYNEKHASLVDRYREITLKDVCSGSLGNISIQFETIAWPARAELDYQKKYLKSYYEKAFGLKGKWDVADIYQNPSVHARHIVIVQHTITCDEWCKNTPELLKWFMDEFWDYTPTAIDPKFLFFFNIQYTTSTGTGLMALFGGKVNDRKKVLKQLDSISLKVAPQCFLLDELRQLKKGHIQQWVDDLKLDEYAHDLPEKLFNKDGKPIETLSMSKVEPELKKVINWIRDEEAKHQLRYE